MPRDLVSVGSAIVDRYYRLSNLPEPDGGAFVRDSSTRGSLAGATRSRPAATPRRSRR